MGRRLAEAGLPLRQVIVGTKGRVGSRAERPGTGSGVERGIRNPTVIIVKRLAIALEVEPPALFATKQVRNTGQAR